MGTDMHRMGGTLNGQTLNMPLPVFSGCLLPANSSIFLNPPFILLLFQRGKKNLLVFRLVYDLQLPSVCSDKKMVQNITWKLGKSML